jgi:hypothetical protein
MRIGDHEHIEKPELIIVRDGLNTHVASPRVVKPFSPNEYECQSLKRDLFSIRMRRTSARDDAGWWHHVVLHAVRWLRERRHVVAVLACLEDGRSAVLFKPSVECESESV